MGWIYIFIRTYPFWAFPTGIALIAVALTHKKGNKRRKQFYFVLSVLLIASSVYFLIMQGHTDAVPFFHQLIYGPR